MVGSVKLTPQPDVLSLVPLKAIFGGAMGWIALSVTITHARFLHS